MLGRIGKVFALGILLVLAGCASAGSVQNAPLHAGIGRTFEAGFDKTLAAAREAAVETGLQIESASQVDQDTWMIIGKKATSAFSWGELVRVVVIRDSAERTTVRVHSARRIKTNITAKGDYANSILSNIELKLSIAA